MSTRTPRELRIPGEASPEVMASLHDTLVGRAAANRLLDIAYRTVTSPVGTLLLARTEQGLVRVAYEREDHDRVLEHLASGLSPRILRAPAHLDDIARQLEAYFEGRLQGFSVPLDLSLARGFRREVLGHLALIGYGQTASYAAVATAAGRPRAVRAVGSACAANPLPVVVPCHRVLRSDGSLGGYVGGLEAKQVLLRLEHRASDSLDARFT